MIAISQFSTTKQYGFAEQFAKTSLALLVVAVVCWAHVVLWTPNHDAAIYIVEAQRLWSGDQFYRDILETNPPLIVFLNLPVVWLNKLTGISLWAGFTLWVGTITLIASYAIDYQIARILPTVPWWLRWQLILLVMVIFPGYDNGQREHFSLCLALPALCKWLADDVLGFNHQSKSTIIIYWVFASLGFLIKPFYLLIPAVFFVRRAWQQRNWRELFCLEAVTLTLVSLIYVTLIWFAFPGWIETMHITRQVYFGFNKGIEITIRYKFNLQIIIFALVSTLLYFLPLTQLCKRLVIALITASGVWLLLAILQGKGWSYHLLPTILLIIFSLGLALADLLFKPRANQPALATYAPQWLWAALSITIFSVFTYFSSKNLPLRDDVVKEPLNQAIANYSQGKPWVIWSTSVDPAFPLAVILPGTWASRSMHQWMVPGTLKLKQRGTTEVKQAESLQAISAHFAIEDLQRWQPEVVAVKTQYNQMLDDANFNFINFFSVDPEFAVEWAHYSLRERFTGWEVYLRDAQKPAETH